MAHRFPWDSFTTQATKASPEATAFPVLLALKRCELWRCQQCSELIISIHQVQPGGDGSSDCIWQKNILMGEKCQLPDFSGTIVYDHDGNLIAPGRPRLLLPLN